MFNSRYMVKCIACENHRDLTRCVVNVTLHDELSVQHLLPSDFASEAASRNKVNYSQARPLLMSTDAAQAIQR